MKYCKECGSEYEDKVTECSECGSELVMKGREQDTRKFVRAGTAEDPLTADDYVRLLDGERIPVFSRPRRGSPVDPLTSGSVSPWWEIMVPEEYAERASVLLEKERVRRKATADEAASAAEEESA